MFYWAAFRDLSNCRPAGFSGLLPIPWSSIDQYANRYQVAGHFYEEFVHIITELDGVYLKWYHDKQEKEAKK